MKQLFTVILAAFVFFVTLPPVFAARAPQAQGHHQQVPTPQGFSTLLCLADALLGGAELPGDPIILFGGQVIVQATSPVSSSNGVSTITVEIIHGKSSSEHTITFIDVNENVKLDCGDTIISVS